MAETPDKIFLIGFMGVGKSHWGTRLGTQLGHGFIDLDERIIEGAGGRSIQEIFAQEGEEAFRSMEADTLRSIIGNTNRFVMACGGGTPCFLKNLEVMKAAGLVIWLRADAAELLPRLLQGKASRPLIRGLDEAQLESYIIRKLGDRNIFYQQAHRSVREADLSDENLIEQLLHA